MTGNPEEHWIAHGILLRGDRALFIRRNEGRYLGGWWDVPGGQVEPGEEPADAAVRELREEGGLEGSVTSELTHYRNVDTEGSQVVFHTVTFGLAEREPGRLVRLDPLEHSDYRWLTFPQAVGLQLVWHVRSTLDQVFGPLGAFRW